MELERVEHEVLKVETIVTPEQTATVRTHHTMFAHVQLQAPTEVQVGQDVTITAHLVRWDDQSPITDEERDLVVTVNGQLADQVATVSGAVEFVLIFETQGTYLVEVTGEKVRGAAVEVVVG